MVLQDLEGCEKEYTTVMADPPWRFNDNLPGGGRGAAKHYECMSMEDIRNLKVPVAENAHLYLWSPNWFCMTGEANSVLVAWGFRPITILTWAKDKIGMGHYFRNDTEQCLFGVKGKLKPLCRSLRTSYHAPRRAHSEKPIGFVYDRVERLSPGPYLELFARGERDGWDCWGFEAGVKKMKKKGLLL